VPGSRPLCAALLAACLVACSGPDSGGPVLPLDTRPEPVAAADPSQPVASGNTRAAADVAAIAALRAGFDPGRNAHHDLATAQVEAQRGGRHIVLELGEAGCIACQRLDEAIEGDGPLRRLRDASLVWVKVDRSGPANADLLAGLPEAGQGTAPHLLLLDAQGKVLQARPGADLVPDGRPDRRRIRELLEQWAPTDLPPAP
jgi:hypothetical protein